jgi:hypothetical protein
VVKFLHENSRPIFFMSWIRTHNVSDD